MKPSNATGHCRRDLAWEEKKASGCHGDASFFFFFSSPVCNYVKYTSKCRATVRTNQRQDVRDYETRRSLTLSHRSCEREKGSCANEAARYLRERLVINSTTAVLNFPHREHFFPLQKQVRLILSGNIAGLHSFINSTKQTVKRLTHFLKSSGFDWTQTSSHFQLPI